MIIQPLISTTSEIAYCHRQIIASLTDYVGKKQRLIGSQSQNQQLGKRSIGTDRQTPEGVIDLGAL